MRPTLRWQNLGRISQAALTKEEGRLTLEGVWLRPLEEAGQWELQASESHVMVIVGPVYVEDDEPLRLRAAANDDDGVFIPLEAVIALERGKNLIALFEDDGSVTIGDVTYHIPQTFVSDHTKEEEREFPVQPAPLKRGETFLPKQGQPYSFTLDPALLVRLANALGARRGVTITVDADKKNVAIRVKNMSSDFGQGIIMPMRSIENG